MTELIDLKDKKILFELEQRSRQSLKQLGKRVGLKKETLFHRIKNLERRGIIKAFLTEIDVYKLGYRFYPVLLRLQDTTPQMEQEIFNYLKEGHFTAWLTSCEGGWDINMTLIAKSSIDIQRFSDELLEKYGRYIKEKHIFITTELHYFKRGFWLNKTKSQTVSTRGETKIEIDATDLKILRILSTKSRTPLVELGNSLGINPKSVAYRIKNLEKDGIIQGSRILVNFSKIGYNFYKVWLALKGLNTENYNRLLAYFRNHPNIIWATKVIGFYDMSIEMEVKDIEEVRTIIGEMKTKFPDLIKTHETLQIFEESVMNYLP